MYFLAKIWLKTAWKWKKLNWEDVCVPSTPLPAIAAINNGVFPKWDWNTVNSRNSDKSLKHDGVHLRIPSVSCCLTGSVVTSWLVHQKPQVWIFFKKNCHWIHWKHLGKINYQQQCISTSSGFPITLGITGDCASMPELWWLVTMYCRNYGDSWVCTVVTMVTREYVLS